MSRRVNLNKIRDADAALRRARALNPHVRMPTMDELHQITRRRPGRSKRDDEPTGTMTIRLPQSLLARLDRHVDQLETRIGLKASRTAIARHALQRYLDAQEDSRRPGDTDES